MYIRFSWKGDGEEEDVDMVLNGHRSAHCGPFLPHIPKRVTEVWGYP